MTRVEEVNKMSNGRFEHFESCSSAAIQLIQQEDGRMVGLLEGGGSWFCAIPNQCLRLLDASKEASVVLLVTRRISAAVYWTVFNY